MLSAVGSIVGFILIQILKLAIPALLLIIGVTLAAVSYTHLTLPTTPYV